MKDNSVKVKVLMVDSVNDELTQRRHAFLESNKRLQHIKFKFCYAVDLDPEQEASIRAHILPLITIVEDDLVKRIFKAAQRSRPQFIILHTGFVFRQNQAVFIRVFTSLKRMIPDVIFGVQMQHGMVRDREAFHETNAVLNLERELFPEVHGSS